MLLGRVARPIAAVAVVTAFVGGSVLAAPSQPLPFTTLVKGSLGGTDKPSQKVIDNAADYKAFFHGQVPAFVDFSKEVVLAVSLGAQPTSGYSIALSKVTTTASGGALVQYVESAPGPFTTVNPVVTQPVHVVKIARGPKSFAFAPADPGLADATYSADLLPQGTRGARPATSFDVQVHEGGTKFTKFVPVHGKDMHLILVSEDLTDFQHSHPSLQTGGTFTTSATLALAQPYAAFVECQPKGYADEAVARTRLFPVGGHAAAPKLNVSEAFFGSNTRTVVVDKTRVVIRAAPNAKKLVQAGVTAHVLIEVRDQSGGAANVQDWLGMPGHAIALSPDLSVFFHEHAARGGSSTGSMSGMPGMHGTSGMAGMPMPGAKYLGPSSDDLTYDLTLPAPGLYKVFFQFQRAGKIVTAPFVVHASP